jgi:hypothetical protein
MLLLVSRKLISSCWKAVQGDSRGLGGLDSSSGTVVGVQGGVPVPEVDMDSTQDASLLSSGGCCSSMAGMAEAGAQGLPPPTPLLGWLPGDPYGLVQA